MKKTSVEISIVNFCARECKLQMSGELSVGWMVEAWRYAQDKGYETGGWMDSMPTVDDVLTLGRLVEPHDNLYGFRRCGVQIGYDVKMDWDDIPRQMVNLMESDFSVFTPAEFFKAYEEIHPFVDGNGRTGQILYNWLNGTLNRPEWAPNFWGDPRRTIGKGAS